MVLFWTLLSYTPDSFPSEVPRRVSTKKLSDSQDGWSLLPDLKQLSTSDCLSALVPAFIITNLFYFDHNVSAQLASAKGIYTSVSLSLSLS